MLWCSRDEAIQNTLDALNNTQIKGLRTTIPFFKALLHNKKFRKGDINTSFIDTEMKSLFYTEPVEELLAAFMATQDFANELKMDEDSVVDYNKGQTLSPWLLNKRLKSL